MRKSYMVNGVVVIPLETSRLAVGVVVVLELPRGGEILGPSIPRRALEEHVSFSKHKRDPKAYRVRAMQVHRRGHRGVVDEANNALTTLLDQKSGTGSDAIIPNHVGGALVWVNLLLEVVDVHLVVVDGAPGDGVGDGPNPCQQLYHVERDGPREHSHDRCLDGRNGHRELIQPRVSLTLPVFCQSWDGRKDGKTQWAKER